MKSLHDLVREFWPIERDAFAAAWPHPTFVVLCVGEIADEGLFGTTKRARGLEGPRAPTNNAKRLANAFIHPLILEPGQDVLIGRGDQSPIKLDDECISKVHARIFRKDDGWILEDCRSTNGTFVDGRALRSAEATPIRDRSLMHFGLNTCCMFMESATLYSYLGMVYRATRSSSGSSRVRIRP